jgi:hypothetical protein
LEAIGFGDDPRVLGSDERGREVLTRVEGEVGLLGSQRPSSAVFRTEAACQAAGDWPRRLHHGQLGAATRLSALADGYAASPDQRSRLLDVCPNR